MSLVAALQKFPVTRDLIYRLGEPRGQSMLEDFEEFLHPGETLLDVGTGIGNAAVLLLDKGYALTPLDVVNLTFTPKITPVIYDGEHMPFKNNQFETALILTVLHHTASPDTVLKEAKRVARRIIVTEDVYFNIWHKYATYFMDSLLNLEFKGHPHTNRTDGQWKATFKRMGLKLKHEKSMKSFIVMRHKLYVLEK
jgi:ubiquinone/menaquinone biosynthesis C-methylase UbiE